MKYDVIFIISTQNNCNYFEYANFFSYFSHTRVTHVYATFLRTALYLPILFISDDKSIYLHLMNRKKIYLFLIAAILLCFTTQLSSAQVLGRIFKRGAPKPPKEQPAPKEKLFMEYFVDGNDTIFVETLPPAMIIDREKMSKIEWRDYYQRVHNFSKAYPYALFVAQVIKDTDDLFEREHYTKRQRDKYLNQLKDDLLKEFDPIFRQLTLKQGLMMIRLIDREVGMTPYYIIKDYLGGVNAGFWQGVAKLLKGNLKQPYEKEGEDHDLELLVGIWEAGEFDLLYWSIFGKDRPTIYIPERFRQSE